MSNYMQPRLTTKERFYAADKEHVFIEKVRKTDAISAHISQDCVDIDFEDFISSMGYINSFYERRT